METESGGLLLEGHYSLLLKHIDELPGPDALVTIDHENENFLKTNSALHESIDIDEVDGVGMELRRQDLKISLLLDLVSELLVRQTQLPPPVATRLTAFQLQCEHEEMATGAKVEAILYVVPTIPRAIRLFGEILSSTEPGWVTMRFSGISPAMQDRIEKMIFTQHRRKVAQGLLSH